jgi:hypothetical protein
MPDHIDKPSSYPVLKLRSVSMSEGPPDLLIRSKDRGAVAQTPGTPTARPAPARPSGPPFVESPASHARTASQADDDVRPTFTARQTPRPAQPERPDSDWPAELPSTRYRFGNALTGEAGPPPIPAIAQRLRQQRAHPPGTGSRTLTPLQRLDDAVRQRLWDPFSPRRLRRPPSAG